MSGPELTPRRRTVFYLSDRTGITAEMLAHSLLTQFEGVEFAKVSCPYVDTEDKARQVVDRINAAAEHDGVKPLLFSTLIRPDVRQIINDSEGMLIDFFDTFIQPLEVELGTLSSHAVGKSHGVASYSTYKARIDAVNFALTSDDGLHVSSYTDSEVILVGVSRTGKTPTCLYLALQYGIMCSNYPLTEDDFHNGHLPESLSNYHAKIFGLTIDPVRLQQIRTERRPGSRYSSLEQCRKEVEAAEKLFKRNKISYFDTSTVSIEEIATTIMHTAGLERRLYG